MVIAKRSCVILFLALALSISCASVGMAKNVVNVWMWEIKDWDAQKCNSDGTRILTERTSTRSNGVDITSAIRNNRTT